MHRRVHTILLAAAALALLLPAPATAATKKLTATVGPGFTITLTMGGKKVKALKAGKYVITVRDRSTHHNFHLTGPGLNRTTSVGTMSTKSWPVTLKKGTYRYVCDPHAVDLKGSFKVT